MGRKLVICCDGTNNSVVGGTTNVLRLFGSLVRDEGQLIFYDSGVGTLTDPTRFTPVGRWLSRHVDMAIGHSLGRSVCAAYRFLCQNWQPGDEVYLFGFSRGAYAVRALAGMVHFLGLLRPEHDSLNALAWNVYADENRDLAESELFAGGHRFAKHFSRPERQIPIHFLGVWDTVSSFGWIWDVRSLPYSSKCPNVRHVRHAAAIDETRAFFPLQAFRRDSIAAGEPHEDSADEEEKPSAPVRAPLPHVGGTFREVWFAGVHSDIGGGYGEPESGLAKISLEWMFREAEQAGLRVDPEERDACLGRIKGKRKAATDPLAMLHDSSRGPWPPLEFVPRKRWDSDRGKKRWYAPNLFRARPIPSTAVIHPSVKQRMDAKPEYRPKNLPSSPTYGDLAGPL